MEKHSHEEAQTGRKSEEERSDREKVRREKMQVREKVGKSRTTVFFQCFVVPDGRKVGLAAGAETSGQIKNCMLLWCEAHWEVKSVKAHYLEPLLEVEMLKKRMPLWGKAHLEVNMCKNTPGSDHFWKLRCRKCARRCGAKHIWK